MELQHVRDVVAEHVEGAVVEADRRRPLSLPVGVRAVPQGRGITDVESIERVAHYLPVDEIVGLHDRCARAEMHRRADHVVDVAPFVVLRRGDALDADIRHVRPQHGNRVGAVAGIRRRVRRLGIPFLFCGPRRARRREHVDPQLPELADDARSAPERIRARNLANELADLLVALGHHRDDLAATRLHLDSKRVDALRSSLGLTAEWNRDLTDGSKLAVNVDVGWNHEWLDRDLTQAARFAIASTDTAFNTRNSVLPRDTMSLRAGLTWQRSERLSIGTGISSQFGGGYSSLQGQVNLRWAF